MLEIVTASPEMLTGVSLSPNISPAADIVSTSLNMPQTLKVTTLVRFSSANSDAVMRKASSPGNRIMPTPPATPFASVNAWMPSIKSGIPSTGSAMTSSAKNMTGVRKNSVENGLLVAGLRSSNICVRLHLKPEKKAELMMSMKPSALNDDSPNTIMTTPPIINKMIPPSFIDGFSSRKRKANTKT